MSNSQITGTPPQIRQAWNDGLFILREKRKGNARGSSIEDRCMYVLGLGWKNQGISELSDNDIANSLFISLRGLTQEAKFFKIGQILWEQCDNDFILKMIESLSIKTPAQSIMYQQVSQRRQQDFKGVFSRAAMRTIGKNSLNSHGILDRESAQMERNLKVTQDSRDSVLVEKNKILTASVNSKRFKRNVTRYRPANAEIAKLAKELTVLLKTTESHNIGQIAVELGVIVEIGYSKTYLVE